MASNKGATLIAHTAAEDGLTITRHAIGNLRDNPLNGRYPLPETMEALARGVGMEYDEIVRAASRSLGRPRLWVGDPTIVCDDSVSPDERESLRRIVQGVIQEQSEKRS